MTIDTSVVVKCDLCGKVITQPADILMLQPSRIPIGQHPAIGVCRRCWKLEPVKREALIEKAWAALDVELGQQGGRIIQASGQLPPAGPDGKPTVPVRLVVPGGSKRN